MTEKDSTRTTRVRNSAVALLLLLLITAAIDYLFSPTGGAAAGLGAIIVLFALIFLGNMAYPAVERGDSNDE